MDYKERIISDHKVMLGKPVVKGTRITVELILKKMAEGVTEEELLRMYPHLQREDVRAALIYASAVIGNEEVIEVQK